MIVAGLVAAAVVVAFLVWRAAVWSVCATRHAALSVAALLVVLLCTCLIVYALFFAAARGHRPRFAFEQLAEPFVLPLFLVAPVALSLFVSQLLVRANVGSRAAQVAAIVAGFVALVVAPFGVIIVGCGLAGVCL